MYLPKDNEVKIFVYLCVDVSHHDTFLEVEATSVYCIVAKHALSSTVVELSAKQHVWDTALFVGILAGKVCFFQYML